MDLPGYGYAKVPIKTRKEWGRLIETYLGSRRSLMGVVVLMDSRHPLTELDQQMLSWCHSSRIRVHVLLTKSDKLSRNELRKCEFQVSRYIETRELDASLSSFSSLKRTGVEQAQRLICDWMKLES